MGWEGKEIVGRFVFSDTDLTEVLMQPGTFGIAACTSPLAAGRTFMVTRACHKPGFREKNVDTVLFRK